MFSNKKNFTTMGLVIFFYSVLFLLSVLIVVSIIRDGFRLEEIERQLKIRWRLFSRIGEQNGVPG